MSTNQTHISRLDFMNKVGLSFGGILLMNCLSACTENEIPDPNPGGGKVNFSIDLNDSQNSALSVNGGYQSFRSNTGSLVIVAKTLNGAWLAVDGECPHQAGIIIYQKNEKNFKCSKTGAAHGSIFNEEGKYLREGSARTDLKKYIVTPNVTNNSISVIE